MQDCVLQLHGGAQVAGSDLRERVDQALRARRLMTPILQRLGNIDVAEQAAILGAFHPELLEDGQAEAVAAAIARRLDGLTAAEQRGWSAETVAAGGFAFVRTLRGVREQHVIDGALMRSSDARKLDEMTGELQAIYEHPATLVSGEREIRITGPIRLVDAVLELGRKGLAVQRYKGLGEMNPDQLWETTLDPNARSLLHVKVSQAQQAGKVFSTLMGDVVDHRREFIQSRALEVINLDV